MKAMCSFLTAVLMMSYFSSCQKGIDWELENEIIGDSVISRVVIIDTSFSAGVDTAQTIDFIYDVSKRLVKYDIIYNTLGVGGPGKIENEENCSYFYSGTQQHPTQLITKYTDYSGPIVTFDTSFLAYTNGYLSRDSFTNGSYYLVSTFERLSNSRYRINHKHDNGMLGQNIDSSYVYVDIQNGNIVKEIDSLWQPGGTWAVASSTTTYDLKPNPLKPIAIPHPAPFYQHFYATAGLSELFTLTENNITLQTNGVGSVLVSLYYEYGLTGLPKIIRDDIGRKYFYFYKKL